MAALSLPTDELGILSGILDWNRATVENKARGLDHEAATRIATPSGVTILGIVNHLTAVEARWFQHHLTGDPDVPSSLGTFAVDPDLTVEEAVAAYRRTCDASRAIAADLSLDHVGVFPHIHLGVVNLRYVLAHMIDETARHLGHMDVLRELTDGQVGDG